MSIWGLSDRGGSSSVGSSRAVGVSAAEVDLDHARVGLHARELALGELIPGGPIPGGLVPGELVPGEPCVRHAMSLSRDVCR